MSALFGSTLPEWSLPKRHLFSTWQLENAMPWLMSLWDMHVDISFEVFSTTLLAKNMFTDAQTVISVRLCYTLVRLSPWIHLTKHYNVDISCLWPCAFLNPIQRNSAQDTLRLYYLHYLSQEIRFPSYLQQCTISLFLVHYILVDSDILSKKKIPNSFNLPRCVHAQ